MGRRRQELDPLKLLGAQRQDDRHARRGVERRAVLKVVASIAVVALSIPVTISVVTDPDVRPEPTMPADVAGVALDAADFVAAVPYAELEALDGKSVEDWRHTGPAAFRVEFAVDPVPTGLRVHAILIDTKTREALTDFVAWRGRG